MFHRWAPGPASTMRAMDVATVVALVAVAEAMAVPWMTFRFALREDDRRSPGEPRAGQA
jgi:hypothetical protein